ncbi:MAG: hypothetical protein ABIR06_03780 [Cyclobacteriaceae bacterium]
MSADPGFEEYLKSKKIDSAEFRKSEPQVWNAWKKDFDQTHPNSFTLQKLNLINPIRRKYLLTVTLEVKPPENPEALAPAVLPTRPGKPVMGKPLMKTPPKVDPNSLA